jgi:hypothetical protein
MAITPFYRERGNGYPGPEGIPMTGQNFFEHQLYNLRTRIEADPVYADYANRFSTILGYSNISQGEKINIGMVIRRVSEVDPNTNYQNIETLSPPWLQELVDKWVDVYPEYAVILTDQYPIKNVPSWWLAEIMPRIDLTDIIQETWFYEDNRNVENYDYFYQDGAIYIRMVNENQNNEGPYSTGVDDFLKTGEKAIKRGEFSYGDRADFQTRYTKLHAKLYYHMINLYDRGTICLDSQSLSVIENWNLGYVMGSINLYNPKWTDVRLTHYEGITNLLKRQLESYKNQWDYRYVYYQVGFNRVLKHIIAGHMSRKTKKMAIFYDSLLAVPVPNYKEAVELANDIDKIKDNVSGSVVPSIYREGQKGEYLPHVIYADMNTMKIIKSIDTNIKLEIRASAMKKEDLDRLIEKALNGIIPAKIELTKMIDVKEIMVN